MNIDYGFITILIWLVITLVATISFPFIHINEVFGLRHEVIMHSEELWHKTHMWASIFTIPFDIILVLCLFIKEPLTKRLLGVLIIFLVIVVWNLVVYFCSKEEVKQKKLKEQKELEENINKESGWR